MQDADEMVLESLHGSFCWECSVISWGDKLVLQVSFSHFQDQEFRDFIINLLEDGCDACILELLVTLGVSLEDVFLPSAEDSCCKDHVGIIVVHDKDVSISTGTSNGESS